MATRYHGPPFAVRVAMNSVTSYKLTVPRVHQHVRRGSLLETLAAIHVRFPLTWMVGLPGAGKTSLAARWTEESGRASIWYRLEESDADVAGLFNALSQAAPAGIALPLWSPDNHADLAGFARRFFSGLGAAPLTLVLDDCHRIPDDCQTLTMLEHVHEVCGDKLRLLLISRRAPPPSLARGVMGGWLGVLDDLRLKPPEARQMAETLRGRSLSGAESEALAQTDGWLAHVLALTRSAPTESLADTASVAGLSSPSTLRVGEFLAAELLTALPKSCRASLRHLAELPEIPQSLASAAKAPNAANDHVPLPPEVAGLLATLSEQRYFVDSTAQGHWRLHDLLRDALRSRNLLEESPAQMAQVRRDLADRVSVLMPEAAMQLRVLAQDVTGVLALLQTHGDAWLSRGLHHTVFDWLTALPKAGDDATAAAIGLWRAQALLPLEPEAARPLFAAAREAGVAAHDAQRAYSAWCGEVASYVVQWGDVQGLADLVDDLEALHSALGPPTGDLAFRTSADALTALMYGRAEDPRMTRYAEATARAVAHAPDAGARITAAGQLLIYKLWWAGDFPGGRALYDAFDGEVSAGEHLAALPRLVWWSCASIVDWQCGQPQDCYDKVERGLALAEASGIHVRDFFLLTQGIFCALSQQDWSRAEHYLGQLARTERTHKRLDAMVHHFFRSWYSLCRGDARTALAHAQTAWPMAEAMGSTFHKIIVLSALAPACVHCGDIEGAIQAYRTQLALAKAARNPTFSFIAFCAGAEIAMAQNDEEALAKQVERILQVKHLGGFHSGCGWRTPMMRDLLAFALRKNIWPEVARQWIREKRISPPVQPFPGWPMPVRILALAGLQVKLDHSDAAPAGGKGAQKLRELLAVLVAEREGASQGELVDWLWPNAEGDKAAASLKVAIHRLRQWLGADAVKVQDSMVALNPAVVACDAWDLLDARSDQATSRLLHGFDSPPVVALRRRLQAG